MWQIQLEAASTTMKTIGQYDGHVHWGAGRTGVCLIRERPVHGRDTFHGLHMGLSIRFCLLLLHINTI